MKSKFTEFKASELRGEQFFYFNLISGDNSYNIIIRVKDGKFIKGSCSCIFGSYYKFSKSNLNEKKECYHINEALELLNFLGYLYNEERYNKLEESTVIEAKQQIGESQ